MVISFFSSDGAQLLYTTKHQKKRKKELAKTDPSKHEHSDTFSLQIFTSCTQNILNAAELETTIMLQY
jgi:hypothetical protein